VIGDPQLLHRANDPVPEDRIAPVPVRRSPGCRACQCERTGRDHPLVALGRDRSSVECWGGGLREHGGHGDMVETRPLDTMPCDLWNTGPEVGQPSSVRISIIVSRAGHRATPGCGRHATCGTSGRRSQHGTAPDHRRPAGRTPGAWRWLRGHRWGEALGGGRPIEVGADARSLRQGGRAFPAGGHRATCGTSGRRGSTASLPTSGGRASARRLWVVSAFSFRGPIAAPAQRARVVSPVVGRTCARCERARDP